MKSGMFDGSFQLIISPRRKRLGLRINEKGVLEVHAPPRTSEAEIRKLLAANLKSVENLFRNFHRRPPSPRYTFTEGEKFPLFDRELTLVFSARLTLIDGDRILLPAAPPEVVKRELEKLYRRTALPLLKEKCRIFGAPSGLLPKSVGITNARTRWGSCSSAKHISFCWKVLLLPEELADYIVCHELAHLRHMDHSKDFWALTEKLCPCALEKRAKLKELPELWI